MRLGEFINFEPWRKKIIISPNRVRYFRYTATLYTYSIYLSTSDLMGFIISNFDKHEFTSTWKYTSCCKDVMNHLDCFIKRDGLPAENMF